jgi:hypothetical protein
VASVLPFGDVVAVDLDQPGEELFAVAAVAAKVAEVAADELGVTLGGGGVRDRGVAVHRCLHWPGAGALRGWAGYLDAVRSAGVATGAKQIAAVFKLRDGRIVAYRSYLRRLAEAAGARSRVILFGRTPATAPTRAATSTSS